MLLPDIINWWMSVDATLDCLRRRCLPPVHAVCYQHHLWPPLQLLRAFILRAMRPMNSWKSMVPLPSWSTCRWARRVERSW